MQRRNFEQPNSQQESTPEESIKITRRKFLRKIARDLTRAAIAYTATQSPIIEQIAQFAEAQPETETAQKTPTFDELFSREKQKEKLAQGLWDGCLHVDTDGSLFIKFSQKVLDALKKDYEDREDVEDIYLLLANKNTGVIEKAINAYGWTDPSASGFLEGSCAYIDERAKRDGYFVVGYYHLHPPIATPQRIQEVMRGALAGDVPTVGTDVGMHDGLENAQFICIGHANPDFQGPKDIADKLRDFKIRIFLYKNNIKEHPLAKLSQEDLEKRKMVPIQSYTGKKKSLLIEIHSKPEPLPQSDDQVYGRDILEKYPPYLKKTKITLSKNEAGELYFFTNPEISEEIKQTITNSPSFMGVAGNLNISQYGNGRVDIMYAGKLIIMTTEDRIKGDYPEMQRVKFIEIMITLNSVPQAIKDILQTKIKQV